MFSAHILPAHLNWLSLITEEQNEGGEKSGARLLLLFLLNPVSWNQMVADLFISTLKVESKEQVTTNWAVLHASKYLPVPNNCKAFVHCIFMQQPVLWLRYMGLVQGKLAKTVGPR